MACGAQFLSKSSKNRTWATVLVSVLCCLVSHHLFLLSFGATAYETLEGNLIQSFSYPPKSYFTEDRISKIPIQTSKVAHKSYS